MSAYFFKKASLEFQTIYIREGLCIVIYLCINNAFGTGTLANLSCRKFARARQENGSDQP